MPATDDQMYPFGYCDEELQRLGEQHRVWQKDHQRLLTRAGFDQGDTLVDLGCGPGFTTLDLVRIVGPTGQIVAVDRDGERSIPWLREVADAAGFGNLNARVADLEHFDLSPESVDGVHGRWVLMYLPEREARALTTRIAKWLRPGGVCAMAEFCNYRHIHIYPAIEHFGLVAEALMQTAAGERGGNHSKLTGSCQVLSGRVQWNADCQYLLLTALRLYLIEIEEQTHDRRTLEYETAATSYHRRSNVIRRESVRMR
jgi:ubiquinone/menaquinone biosynthesis C-methylase UbiE